MSLSHQVKLNSAPNMATVQTVDRKIAKKQLPIKLSKMWLAVVASRSHIVH